MFHENINLSVASKVICDGRTQIDTVNLSLSEEYRLVGWKFTETGISQFSHLTWENNKISCTILENAMK
jgi:hypothetical protein